MRKVLVVESDPYDADRFQSLLANDDFEIVRCDSGVAAERAIVSKQKEEFAAVILLWEIPGPPFGFSLLGRCRQLWPETPVVIVSDRLDAALATRAHLLGARDFLEKPLESERVKSSLRSLLSKHDLLSPLIDELSRTIIGESPALVSTLKQVARLIPHVDSRALFIGESGTGKELFAQAIHKLGARAEHPWVAVNVGEIPRELIESALFGHEKGSFTGAIAQRKGVLEEAGQGTLFLDEIGDLELSLQVKLLRVIQEKQFRRIGGAGTLLFEARLVCATNRDLAQAVRQGAFRQDLFHRIAEKTIHIPPLRERRGDVEILLNHFLGASRGDREIRFARETLTILRSYPFPGNVRELQNLVNAALIDCDGELILPQHLPLPNMAAFLATGNGEEPVSEPTPPEEAGTRPPNPELLAEMMTSLPPDWRRRPYREVAQMIERAFDRVYLRQMHDYARGNITRAAAAAGVDTKTFRKRWKESGLLPLGAGEGDADG